jgi:hypothetical protein
MAFCIKVLHKYHEEFEEASFKKGDEGNTRLIKEWSDMADYANNMVAEFFILEEKE